MSRLGQREPFVNRDALIRLALRRDHNLCNAAPTKFSRCVAAHKMRLAVKLQCFPAAGDAHYLRSAEARDRTGARSLRCKSPRNERRQKREWEDFHVEGQFVSCRAGEPVYVG